MLHSSKGLRLRSAAFWIRRVTQVRNIMAQTVYSFSLLNPIWYVTIFNFSPDAVVGVHCTHGLNRSGYVVCRWEEVTYNSTKSDFIMWLGNSISTKNNIWVSTDAMNPLVHFRYLIECRGYTPEDAIKGTISCEVKDKIFSDNATMSVTQVE